MRRTCFRHPPNALLKTLEEPPPNTIFVLATTEAHKVPATIVDRCHRFDFQRPSLEEISQVLRKISNSESIEADDRALAMIARSAAGSFRDAIGTLDQLVTYGGNKVVFEDVLEVLDVADADLIFDTTEALVGRDPKAALQRVDELSASGRDPSQFMRDLVAHLRQLVVIQTIGEAPDTFSVTADQTERLEAQARELPQSDAVRAMDLVSAALAAVKEGSDPRIQLELALLKAAGPRSDPSIEALLSRIEQLERTAGGSKTPSAPPKRAAGARAGPAEEKPSPGAPARAAEPATDTVADPAPAEPEAPRVVQELGVLWPAVLDRVRAVEGGPMLGALLADARPSSLDEGSLVIGFPPSAAFSKRKIETPANHQRVRDAVRQVTGHTLVLRFELIDDADGEDAGDQPTSEHEAIERVKELFDAEDVLEEAPGDGPPEQSETGDQEP